jgi:hypothetical protein
VPLLAFGLILGPLTVAMVTAAEGKGFWSTFALLWNHKEFINGPLWFNQALLLFSLAALAVRQVVPVGVNRVGLQLGYFASYTFLFSLGIGAWRHDWLRQLKWENACYWIIALPFVWLSLPALSALAIALNGPGKSDFSGGLSWSAIFYAFWEPFIAWGMITAWLLVFRRYMNRPSGIWTWLNRRSYAVYTIHPLCWWASPYCFVSGPHRRWSNSP